MGVAKTEVIVTVHPSFKANRAARLRDWRRSASMRVLPLEATGQPRLAPELAAGIRRSDEFIPRYSMVGDRSRNVLFR